jgi:outer membrane protein assembly factor BamB
MTTGRDTIFVGVKGSVLAIDRATGATVWQTHLKGGDFVNVVLQDGDLYAATKGRLFRLDPATGGIQWTNDLPGYGLGIVSIAGTPQGIAAAAEKKHRDAQAASAGAVAAASTAGFAGGN